MMRNFSVGLFLTCSGVFLVRLHFEIFKEISFLLVWFYMSLTLYKFGKGFGGGGGNCS